MFDAISPWSRVLSALGLVAVAIMLAGVLLPREAAVPPPEVVAEGTPVELAPVPAPAAADPCSGHIVPAWCPTFFGSSPTPIDQASAEIAPDDNAPDPAASEPTATPPVPPSPEPPASTVPAPPWPKFDKPRRRPALATGPATPPRDLITRALGGGA